MVEQILAPFETGICIFEGKLSFGIEERVDGFESVTPQMGPTLHNLGS